MNKLDRSFIDLVITYYPLENFQRRALESHTLTMLTLADVLQDPEGVAFALRMTPGVGLKSISVVHAAVHAGLNEVFGADWVQKIDTAPIMYGHAMAFRSDQLRRILAHWPRVVNSKRSPEPNADENSALVFISRYKRSMPGT